MSVALEPTIQFWDRVTETPVGVPMSAFQLSGFREWAHSDGFPASGQVSFLNGEVFVDMSPEDLETHNKCKTGLTAGWYNFLTTFDVGEVISDGMLLLNDQANLGTEPDGLLCLYESIRSKRVQYTEVVEGSDRFVEVRGAPDLAAEVVSRSSVRKDTVTLMDLYYRAGISEHWLIDARRSEIDFRIFVRGENGFTPAEADQDGFVRSGVLNHWFCMTRTRTAVGYWRYALEFRA